MRGDGGCIMAPPSIHPTGQVYSWRIDVAELAAAPEWLVALTRKKSPSISERALANLHAYRAASSDRYGRAALDDEIAQLASTPPGQRNHALNRATFSLFQLVAGGELGREEVTRCLVEACHRNGLVNDDGLKSVVATIRSGGNAGLKYPRSRRGVA